MLDFDLAALYEVETRVLNQAVKRNLERFPDDFMFQLSTDEWWALSAQIGVKKSDLSTMKLWTASLHARGKKESIANF